MRVRLARARRWDQAGVAVQAVDEVMDCLAVSQTRQGRASPGPQRCHTRQDGLWPGSDACCLTDGPSPPPWCVRMHAQRSTFALRVLLSEGLCCWQRVRRAQGLPGLGFSTEDLETGAPGGRSRR